MQTNPNKQSDSRECRGVNRRKAQQNNNNIRAFLGGFSTIVTHQSRCELEWECYNFYYS